MTIPPKKVQIAALLEAGLRPHEIKMGLRVAGSLVSRVRSEFAIPKFAVGRVRNRNEQTIRVLKSRGLTHEQVGQAVNLSRSGIANLLRRKDFAGRDSGTCEQCGKPAARVERHHEDYLEGRGKILCSRCHRREHPRKTKPIHGTQAELFGDPHATPYSLYE